MLLKWFKKRHTKLLVLKHFHLTKTGPLYKMFGHPGTNSFGMVKYLTLQLSRHTKLKNIHIIKLNFHRTHSYDGCWSVH